MKRGWNKREVILVILAVFLMVGLPLILMGDFGNITGFTIFQGKEISDEDFQKLFEGLPLETNPDEPIVLSSRALVLGNGDKSGLAVRFLNAAQGSIATGLNIKDENKFFDYDLKIDTVEAGKTRDWKVRINIPEEAEKGEYLYYIEAGGRSTPFVIVVE